MVFSFGDGTEVFIAKPTPRESAVSQSQAYLEVGVDLATPPISSLTANSNDDAVIAEVSRRLGIESNLFSPPPGQSRDPLEATVRHTVYYLFQPQGLVASKDFLFYKQGEQYIPQAIKDTLPYFLGAVKSERVAIEHELRIARRRLKLALRDLEEAESTVHDQLTRGRSLVTECQQAGILPTNTRPEGSSEIIAALKIALTWTPEVPPALDFSKVSELRAKVNEDHERVRGLYRRIEAAEVFQFDSEAFVSEAGEQVMRLQSIRLFDGIQNKRLCPLCSTDLSSETPQLLEMNASLERLSSDLSQVATESPRLREYIDGLKDELERARQILVQDEFSLRAAVSEQDTADELRDANARAARVVGRVSLYLETLQLVKEDERLSTAVEAARSEIQRLEQLLGDDTEDLLVSILNRIGNDMTDWSKQLELEHPGPYRLDFNNLTVVADRPGRPIPMQRMGGGKNYLGCHLLALVALHTHFIEAKRPVPAILVLDQPSQVYFFSPQKYEQLSGRMEDTVATDADLDAVRRIFQLLFRACTRANGEFQVIVMEHANLPDDAYQNALVEEPWSGVGEHALIPESWKG